MTNSSLAEIISKYTQGKNLFNTDIKGLSLHRYEAPTNPASYLFSPHLCLIAQGAKRIMLGKEAYTYDVNNFLISSVDLPVVSQVLEATQDKPYLGLTLELDLEEISQLIAESSGLPDSSNKQEVCGMGVSKLSKPLLSAVQRLLDLLETPADIPILAPVIKKEIYYRLLSENYGCRLRQIVSVGGQKHQISRAINLLKDNFNKQLHIKDLADFAGMSESTFHQHFRLLTAMSPLQFQKKIRLNEARRLMLVEDFDAGSASFEVGYESPTQFNREYKRMFGNPPAKDVKQILTS